MALFIGIHKFSKKKVGPRQLKLGWRGYKRACRKMGLTPVLVTYNMRRGMAWCLTKASSKSQVAKAHKNVLAPLKEILEVKTMK